MSGKNIFVDKYSTKSLKDFVGQDESILLIKRFIINFRKGKKACIIHGPTGSGKTSLIYALANDMGFEVIELNASDFRGRKDIESHLKRASEQKSLFSKSKIILIDEIDGIVEGKDRGGLTYLESFMLESQYPIFLTANDIWQKKFNSIRQKCELVQLREANHNLITLFLERICTIEGIKANKDALLKLAIKERGDFRAALNDIQVLCSGSSTISNEDVDKINEREKDEGIFNALQLVFKMVKLDSKILSAYENLNMNLDDVSLWLDENIPKEYSGKELAKAYDFMSKSDIFKRRIMRQQHWGFLVYQNMLLTAGISSAKSSPKPAFTKYQRPSRLLKIWMFNRKKEQVKSISIKYARFTHCSIKRAVKEFEILKIIFRRDKIREELNLTEEETEFLRN